MPSDPGAPGTPGDPGAPGTPGTPVTPVDPGAGGAVPVVPGASPSPGAGPRPGAAAPAASTPRDQADEPLAFTGADPRLLAAVGLGVLLLGAGALLLVRRRRLG